MLYSVSDCAMILGHNVDTEGRGIKFVLFFTSRCVFGKRKAAGWKLKESCSHPYDTYVVGVWKKRDWQNSVKFRNFRLIVPIEACGSRILHNVEVKMRSVKFRNQVSKSGHLGAFLKLNVQF